MLAILSDAPGSGQHDASQPTTGIISGEVSGRTLIDSRHRVLAMA
jgi:hypothetical protein